MYAYSAGLDSMSSQLEMRGVASEQLPHDIRFSTHLSSWQREVAGLLDKVNVMQGEIEEIEKSIRTACWVEMRDWQ